MLKPPPVPRFRDGSAGTTTESFTPSKLNASETLPAAKVAPPASRPLRLPTTSSAELFAGHHATRPGMLATVHTVPTRTSTRSLRENSASSAVNLRTYKPGALNVAVVFAAFGLPKVTEPGPLARLQVICKLVPGG